MVLADCEYDYAILFIWSALNYVENEMKCPISEKIVHLVLSLPMYPGLENEVIYKIAKIVNQTVFVEE